MKAINDYISAAENILIDFRMNRTPDQNDIWILTTKTKPFNDELRALYLGDTPAKKERFEIIIKVVSEARFYICKENFDPRSYNDIWRAIVHSLDMAYQAIEKYYLKAPEPVKEKEPIPAKEKEPNTIKGVKYTNRDIAAILYFSSILEGGSKTKKQYTIDFIKKHGFKIAESALKNRYLEVRQKIENDSYKTIHLEKIKPFIAENYPEGLDYFYTK